MAIDFQQRSRGLVLQPQATDPSTPVDGDFYFSDGTIREIGLWQYKSGAWASIVGSGGIGSGGVSSTKDRTLLGYVTSGSELVTNGTLDINATGWTLGSNNSWTAGVIQQTYSAGGGPATQALTSLATGVIYTFSADSRMVSGTGNTTINVYNGANNSGTLLFSATNSTTGWVTSTGVFTALSSNVFIQLYNGGDPVTLQFDNISIKETTINPYTVLTTDNGKIINIDTSAGAIEVILPAPTDKFIATIKDYKGTSATNKIHVILSGNLDGISTTIELIETNFSAVTLVSDGTNWFRVARFNGSSPLSRGLFGGGIPTNSVVIDHITIPTASNATSFGSLSTGRVQLGAHSSSLRALFIGGSTGSDSNLIDYVSFATLANAVSFGTLTVARLYVAGCGSSTRGVAGGGSAAAVVRNTIDYVTFATVGNATNFGNLTLARSGPGALSSTTRGVFAGGNSGSETAVMDYVTIATTGNAISFGNLTGSRDYECGASNSTRGLFGGGGAAGVINVDYIAIATTANAINFGNLSATRTQLAGCASSLRAVFAGGLDGAVASLTMGFFTIASLGNSTNFGNLTVARRAFGGCSNVHGGL